MRAVTWVGLFFLCATVLCAFVLNLALTDLLAVVRVNNSPILGEQFTLSTLLAVALAGGAGAYLAFVDKRSRRFVEESIVELDKVNWPSAEETKASTIVVIITSFLAAAILGVFDSVFSWLTNHNLFLY